MTILFVTLIVIAAIVLGFFVLIQNPKGGGLSGTIGGFSTQFMGVKQTTDVLEKGTWIFSFFVGLLCICSVFFIPANAGSNPNDRSEDAKTAPVPIQTAPKAGQQTLPVTSDAAPVINGTAPATDGTAPATNGTAPATNEPTPTPRTP